MENFDNVDVAIPQELHQATHSFSLGSSSTSASVSFFLAHGSDREVDLPLFQETDMSIRKKVGIQFGLAPSAAMIV